MLFILLFRFLFLFFFLPLERTSCQQKRCVLHFVALSSVWVKGVLTVRRDWRFFLCKISINIKNYNSWLNITHAKNSIPHRFPTAEDEFITFIKPIKTNVWNWKKKIRKYTFVCQITNWKRINRWRKRGKKLVKYNRFRTAFQINETIPNVCVSVIIHLMLMRTIHIIHIRMVLNKKQSNITY